MNLSAIQTVTSPIFQKYRVERAALFGSTARNDTNPASDIDILVELHPKATLFDFINLQLDLEDQLQKKVDLLEFSAIKPRLKSYILRDQTPIYQKS